MIGLSLFLVVTVGVVVWLTTRDSTYHAPVSGTPAAKIDQTRATALLDDLRRAVSRRDAAAAGRLGATPAARADLAGVARNARALHVTGFSLRYVDSSGAVAADGVWSADVAATWRFAGFDHRLERVDVRVRFAPAAGGLGIDEIGGGAHRSPLWLSGPLQVRRGVHSMVLVDGSAARADRIAALARRAVPSGTAGAARLARGPRGRGAGVRGRARRRARCTLGSVPEHRRRHHGRRRFTGSSVAEPCLRESAGLPPTEAPWSSSRDHPRGHSRRHAREHEPRADLAGRGVRRLRRPELAAPSRHHDRGPDHRAGPSQRHPRSTFPGVPSSRPEPITSRRGTRAPGWPVACWLGRPGRRTSWRSTRRWTPAAPWHRRCIGTSDSARSPSSGSGGPSCHTCRRE